MNWFCVREPWLCEYQKFKMKLRPKMSTSWHIFKNVQNVLTSGKLIGNEKLASNTYHQKLKYTCFKMGRIQRIWFLSPVRAAKVQVSLRIRAVSPDPPLLAHTSSKSRGTFRQKARSLAPLNGWACAVRICHDGMLEDTNSLDGAQNDILQVSKFTFINDVTWENGIGYYEMPVPMWTCISDVHVLLKINVSLKSKN